VSRPPNFFLVGAAKSGTTSLYASLAAHPEIFLSPLKEPHYFSRFEVDRRTARLHRIVRDEESYRELFSGATTEPVVGEGSTSYLWDPQAPGRIAQAAPGARIVAILRDPVDRAYSHYLNDVREGFESRTFLEAVTQELARPGEQRWPSLYVGFGRYGEQLPRYLDRFDAVHVLFFEQFVADAQGELRRVLEFLEVDPDRARVEAAAENPYARPRSELARRLFGSAPVRLAARAVVPASLRPAGRRLVWRRDEKHPIDPRARALLDNVFRPDVRRVAELVGAEPPWAPR
jgi:Sulfotransferase family